MRNGHSCATVQSYGSTRCVFTPVTLQINIVIDCVVLSVRSSGATDYIFVILLKRAVLYSVHDCTVVALQSCTLYCTAVPLQVQLRVSSEWWLWRLLCTAVQHQRSALLSSAENITSCTGLATK